MIIMGNCYAFMILLIYIAFKFLMTGNESIDILMSLMTFTTAFSLLVFIFGTVMMGELVKTEVVQAETIMASD